MPIVDIYKSEFKVFIFDEDLSRSDHNREFLVKSGFSVTSFNSRGLFMEALKGDLPHVFILYYQPLSMRFRELLDKVRETSSEVEIVLLGSKEFWPGVSHLIKNGCADDFWSWPAAAEAEMELRLNRMIEKFIYKMIAEQRSDATAKIMASLESLREREMEGVEKSVSEGEADLGSMLKGPYSSEARLIEDLVNHLKDQFPRSEFIYMKNYHVKNQLLVTRTSFSGENYFRGQSIPFNQNRLTGDRNQCFVDLRNLIEETFSCDQFSMQPVELGDEFYGLIMAVEFESHSFLQKTARYLSLNLRNLSLENSGKGIEIDKDQEVSVVKNQLPVRLSTEVSRARRLKSPLSMIVAQIEFVQGSEAEKEKCFEIIKNCLRPYDLLTELSGDQLAIALPHCDYENAAIKAERLRRHLVARGLKSQNTPLRLCFGVSEFPSLSPDSDSLLADARKACNQVIVSGKNKVCLYSAEEDFQPEFETVQSPVL